MNKAIVTVTLKNEKGELVQIFETTVYVPVGEEDRLSSYVEDSMDSWDINYSGKNDDGENDDEQSN